MVTAVTTEWSVSPHHIHLCIKYIDVLKNFFKVKFFKTSIYFMYRYMWWGDTDHSVVTAVTIMKSHKTYNFHHTCVTDFLNKIYTPMHIC